MAEILTFSHCLNKLMQKHGLTPNQLCTSIGCTRSDIKQLMSAEGTEAKRNSIFEKIKACSLFLPEELWALEHSLEVSRIGLEQYRFQSAIDHILSGTIPSSSMEMLSAEGKTLSSVFSAYQQAEEVEILCLNSCFPGVIQAIRPLFDQPDREIRMRHLLSQETTRQRSGTYVATVLPLLFDCRYEPFEIHVSASEDLPPIGGNMLAIRGITNGKERESYISVVNASSFFELPNAEASQIYHFMSNLFNSIRSQLSPLKETENPQEDFTSLCMTFLSHELNRATYSLTNSLCFQQFPTKIAIAAINGADFFSEKEAAVLIKRTIAIHEQRFQNFYHKRKPAYMIMTQRGCEQFLETGVSLDHFVGFRPFTPAERQVIFETMLSNAENNPYFSPLLMKDPHFQHRYNLECYDKLGVSLDATDTNYDLASGYHPVFLMFPEFTRQYLSYYLETLVNERCYSRETTLRILNEMYHRFIQKFGLQKTADAQ
ncbi:MAG: hypothetical protein J6K55_10995 [Clostridia bacterium]|nr:hypothetical protein [Clostridia bacterium]